MSLDFFQEFGESPRDRAGLDTVEQYRRVLQMLLGFQSRAPVMGHMAARFCSVFDEGGGAEWLQFRLPDFRRAGAARVVREPEAVGAPTEVDGVDVSHPSYHFSRTHSRSQPSRFRPASARSRPGSNSLIETPTTFSASQAAVNTRSTASGCKPKGIG